MPTWKLVLLRTAGFGGGFALVLSAVIGGWVWYSGRPKAPKPWNKQAITAEYDYARPSGEKDYLTFHYILQNNTDFDYRVDSSSEIQITGRLKQEKGYSAFSNQYVTTEYPVFVPAKNRVWVSLSIPYPYPVKEKEKPTDDERKEFTTAVAKYIADKISNLDGFVWFDTRNRYQIDFPGGWEARAKQASAKNK
jgi:hypothetical protein